MKEFLKTSFAVLIGAILAVAVLIVAVVTILPSLASPGAPLMPQTGVLKIDLSKTFVCESPYRDINVSTYWSNVEMPTEVSTWQVMDAISKAATDPMVQSIYLKTDGNLSSLSVLSELRCALAEFRSSGKPVIAYLEHPTTGEYYLASIADKVYMTSYAGASNTLLGVSASITNVKDLLEAFGVKVRLIKHGSYKSAGEFFTNSSPSKENLEQTRSMVNSLWDTMADDISLSRNVPRTKIDDCVDNLLLSSPEDFLKAGLVDKLVCKDSLRTIFEDKGMFQLHDYVQYLADSKAERKNKDKVAVLVLDGEIVEGRDLMNIAGDRYESIISGIKADSTVKAVVLRVNSPGGSVLASDKLRKAVDALCQVKPVVASYGGYAASGGYWVSSGVSKIYTCPVTLTGSIGVFSLIPDFSGTLKKFHINRTNVSSGAHSDMYSCTRPLDSKELEYFQASIDTVYSQFVSVVATGRGLTEDYVDSIGGGRVWTGVQAVENKLADDIGTISDAVRYAALSSDLSDYRVVEYPRPQTIFESLLSLMTEDTDDVEEVVVNVLKGELQGSGKVNFARLPFEIRIL